MEITLKICELGKETRLPQEEFTKKIAVTRHTKSS